MAVYRFTQLTAHPTRPAGAGQGHLRRDPRDPSERVPSVPPPTGHTARRRCGPRACPRGDGGRLLGGRRSPRGPGRVRFLGGSLDEWLKERGREVYHFEPAQTLEVDEEVFEAGIG